MVHIYYLYIMSAKYTNQRYDKFMPIPRIFPRLTEHFCENEFLIYTKHDHAHRRNVLYNTIYIKNIQWSRISDDEEKIRCRIVTKIRRGVNRRRPRRIYCRRLQTEHLVTFHHASIGRMNKQTLSHFFSNEI